MANNFDLVRLVLAFIVVVAHSIILTNNLDYFYLLNYFNSYLAVKGFFVISGFLVFRSYENSNNLKEYAKKRLNRILPGYVAVILLTTLYLLLIIDIDKKNLESCYQLIKYTIFNLLFIGTFQSSIPGVFETNYIKAINGSLWTIKVELCLYALIPILHYYYEIYNNKIVTLIVYLIGIIWVVFFDIIFLRVYSEQLENQFIGQLSYFIIGCYFAQNYQLVKKHITLALLLMLGINFWESNILNIIVFPYAFSVIIIFICIIIPINIKTSSYGDISYGIYLYHFPVIQILISINCFSEKSEILSYIFVYILIIIIGYISWHFIEKKFLRSFK